MAQTLLELMRGNYNDTSVGLVEEVSRLVPEIAFFDARVIKATQFKTLARTGLPTAGFRRVNEGVVSSGSTYAMKTFDLGLLDCIVKMDKAIAEGDIMGKDMALAREAFAVVLAGMKKLAAETWYGTGAGGIGFPGAKELVAGGMLLGNLSGGLTAGTGSSVFAVGNSVVEACGYTFGGDGSRLLSADAIEFKEALLKDSASKEFAGYWADLTTWAGLSVVNANRLACFDNLTEDSGKGLTDEVLARLVNAYMEANDGLRPDGLFMSFRSREQLQLSRKTVLVAQGRARADVAAVAAVPTEYDGIPIFATSAVSKTEAIRENPVAP